MEHKPTLFYQTDKKGFPLFPFCYSAAKGALEADIDIEPFTTDECPQYDPYNIIVGSVEKTIEYLLQKYKDPVKEFKAIDDSWAAEFKKRNEQIMDISEVNEFPCFVKPNKQIKAFTGFIAENREQLDLFARVNVYGHMHPFLGSVKIQDIVNVQSEYRVYVSNLRGIIGIYRYLGNPFAKLNRTFVEYCTNISRQYLSEQSYTLDFGIDDKGETFLIEINDGWAIGNYGLDPKDYYHFIKNRFLQLTGVIK